MLENETVIVDNVEYIATNVTATTFEINATVSTFESVTWKPFEDLNLPIKERVFA